MTEPDHSAILKARLNQETARVDWHELQPFFARGQTVAVAGDLDLVEVAVAFAEDRVDLIGQWRAEARVGAVSDDQARAWVRADQRMWAVVVKPWVLVQAVRG